MIREPQAPSVSVIISTYNRAYMLRDALASVFAQTYQDFEVIVVDDGSTDATRDVVGEYGGRVHYIYQQNEGYCRARNSGIRVARGKYIAFLNDDDVWLPRKLEIQVHVLETRPEISLVCGPARVVRDREVRLAYCEDPPEPPDLVRCLVGWYIEHRQIVYTPTVVTIRRDILDRSGYFDPALEAFEDWDLWIRVASAGGRFARVSDPVAEYRLHESNISNDHARMNRAFIAVLEKTLHASGTPYAIRVMRRHYLSRGWIAVGNAWYADLEFGRAWSAWWRGIRSDPTAVTPGLLFLMAKSLCGPRAVSSGRALKRRAVEPPRLGQNRA